MTCWVQGLHNIRCLECSDGIAEVCIGLVQLVGDHQPLTVATTFGDVCKFENSASLSNYQFLL